MRISGSLPFNVAQAYGIKPQQVATTTPATPVEPVARTRPTGTEADSAAHVRSLVAATVQGGVTFDGASTIPAAKSSLTLYTRAADTIEAATSIELGRRVDMRG